MGREGYRTDLLPVVDYISPVLESKIRQRYENFIKQKDELVLKAEAKRARKAAKLKKHFEAMGRT